ncbi:hypothetical protein P1J78_00655 [Psychromarinibacter sp. C21-152]|uniref:Uncharacterized protein n=1 Tax=Psychromarinibacter sediminicola TaxID=3033385 RepID=A0AAE3T741_9RHOB|nr:hypothetical protein [Psychromarinibacter sediminicola]MDF0599228.1 hypothetical protein [Psychromarinibacter sediminicola]
MLLLLAGTLAGCGVARNVAGAVGFGTTSARGPNRVEINDITFRSRLEISGEDKRELTITVRPVRVDPEAAQEAGRYRATVYCLRRFGSSAAEWDVGPDLPVDQLRIVDDSITLRGRCEAR